MKFINRIITQIAAKLSKLEIFLTFLNKEVKYVREGIFLF